MTDHTQLRKLATEALHWVPICDEPDCSCREAWKNYADAANPQAVLELLAERDALKKDAERYRWLRKTTNWVSSGDKRIDVCNNPELWDSAIDAAISKMESTEVKS